MTHGTFAIALLLGSGLLALWLDVRVPRLAPQSVKAIALHLALAFAAIQLIPGGTGSAAAKLGIVFGIALPALVYFLLATIWVLKHAQSAMGAAR